MHFDRTEFLQRAAAYWNTASKCTDRIRWWHSPTIIRHINRKLGVESDVPHAGFHATLAGMKGAPFKKAVSVGCGDGSKEISLVKAGIVKTFHLYEISAVRADLGREIVISSGLEKHVFFHVGDAFTLCRDKNFDLVYWNNALHHMPDTWEAVRWSYERLKPGGVFAMDDFIGAARFQWSELALRTMSDFRATLPESLLSLSPGCAAPREVSRPDVAYMISMDPSEAADSANILPAIRAVFPGSWVVPTGGHIYQTALANILKNFEEDSQELHDALHVDDLLSKAGENQYAVAFCRKPE